MIAWSHLSQAQCYFQKELGGVPSSDIYEHHMQYKDILMDVVRAIQSEARSPFISSEESFMLFSSPEYCLTFKAELTISQLESALELFKNNTLLTNMILFPKLAFCYTEEDGYPAILGTQDCKAWIEAIQEELNLINEISTESTQFLHLAVDQDKLIGINTLTYKSEVLCFKSQQITLDIQTQDLVKNKILNILNSLLNIGKILKLGAYTSFHESISSCISRDWQVKDLWSHWNVLKCIESQVSRKKRSTVLGQSAVNFLHFWDTRCIL